MRISRLPSPAPFAMLSLLLFCGGWQLDAADAQPQASPAASTAPAQAAEVLKTMQSALDDLALKKDADGVYAIVDGKLVRLQCMAGSKKQTADDAKKSNLLSTKPCLVLLRNGLGDHPPAAGSIFGYDWRVMDVRPPRKVAFVTQPVPDQPDMLLLMPADTLKPGLFSVQTADSQEGEYRFGVQTPDEEVFWRQVVKDQPNSWHAHSHLGAMLWFQHDMDGALAQWKRSAELKPQVYETHNNYALALSATGRLSEALEQYKQAVATGGPWTVRLNYAHALQTAKKYDEAIKQYDAIEKLAVPARADVLIDEGTCFLAQGEWDVAVASFQMALQIDPANADAKQRLIEARKKLVAAAEAADEAWKGK